MKKIEQIRLQVALKEKEYTQSFTFLRSWTPPRTIHRLTAEPLALENVTFLVVGASLAAEELLNGLPVLRHLSVD